VFDEYEQHKFIEEMKRSYAAPVSQWCATSYATNRN
jgi:hypothetical protein